MTASPEASHKLGAMREREYETARAEGSMSPLAAPVACETIRPWARTGPISCFRPLHGTHSFAESRSPPPRLPARLHAPEIRAVRPRDAAGRRIVFPHCVAHRT